MSEQEMTLATEEEEFIEELSDEALDRTEEAVLCSGFPMSRSSGSIGTGNGWGAARPVASKSDEALPVAGRGARSAASVLCMPLWLWGAGDGHLYT